MRIFFVHIRFMHFSEILDRGLGDQDHFMVVGNPIAHSLSPLMHNLALRHHSINAIYYPIELNLNELSAFAAHLNKPTFKGLNVTIPFKQEFMSFVDELMDVASEIGAVNTLYKDNGKLIGTNTDAAGFLSPLEAYKGDLEGERALVFGTGGASRAVVYALEMLGMEEIILVSRKGSLAAENRATEVVSYDAWPDYAEDATLIVNTTPLGMAPHVDLTPVEEKYKDLLEGKICYDLVYNPLITRFLKQAEDAGAEVLIHGLEMFIQQGNESFKLWTGRSFPEAIIRKELEGELGV
jgi:shikimate dehydrogenase